MFHVIERCDLTDIKRQLLLLLLYSQTSFSSTDVLYQLGYSSCLQKDIIHCTGICLWKTRRQTINEVVLLKTDPDGIMFCLLPASGRTDDNWRRRPSLFHAAKSSFMKKVEYELR